MTENTIYVQDNGLVLVTPKNESTLMLTTKQVCDACKKQIPKKVEHSEWYPQDRDCPNCFSNLATYGDNTINNCPYCGQALDWGDNLRPTKN